MIIRWRTQEPRLRRVARIVLQAPLVLSAIGMFLTGALGFGGGSMTQGAGIDPGAEIQGSFTYLQRLEDGRTAHIPVIPSYDRADPSFRIVLDPDRRYDTGVSALEEQRRLGPLQPGAPGFVDLPKDVMISERQPEDVTILDDASEAQHNLYLPWVGWKGHFLVSLPPTLTLFGLGAALLTFSAFLGSIVDGRPFAPENSARLLRLAGFLAVAAVASTWLKGWIGRAVLAVSVDHGHDIPLQVSGPSLHPLTIFIVAAAVMLAFAFRAGTRLTTDAEGLV